jgi:hypothetical protein
MVEVNCDTAGRFDREIVYRLATEDGFVTSGKHRLLVSKV